MNPPSAAPHASIHSSGRDRKPAASLAVLKGRHTASLLSAHRHVRQALSRRTSRLWLLVCHQPRTSPCRHGHRSQSGRVYGQETINLLQVSVVVGCIVGLEAKKEGDAVVKYCSTGCHRFSHENREACFKHCTTAVNTTEAHLLQQPQLKATRLRLVLIVVSAIWS